MIFFYFQNLTKIKTFVIFIDHKPSLGTFVRSQTKSNFGPDRFSRYDVYWLQTDSYTQIDKQTDRLQIRNIYQYLYTLLAVCLFVCLYPINVNMAEQIGPNFVVDLKNWTLENSIFEN